MTEDALQTIKLRSDFYRDGHRHIVITIILSLLLNGCLIAALVYLIDHPPAPRYFATTVNGRITPTIPLDQPNMSPAALLEWTNSAAIAAYTYNFVNYRQELQSASEFFTPEGWQKFINSLESSNNLNAVLQKKLVVSAVATAAPIIANQGVNRDHIYTWTVKLPIMVTYQSIVDSARQTVNLTMTVQRVSTLNSSRGIGISSFVGE